MLLDTAERLDRVSRDQLDLAIRLREQRDFSDTTLSSLVEGVLAFGPDGAVLQVNRSWSQITGYPAEEIIGHRPPFPWWPPERIDERLRYVQTALTSTTTIEFDAMVCRPDGTQVRVLATTSPIRDDAGDLRMVLVTYRDLTDHVAAEAERRRFSDQLDHFFTMSHDLMCIAGTDGYFKRVNPAFERTLGYTSDELLGRPFIDLVHPDDVDRTRAEAAWLAEGTGVSVAFENRYRCKDGTYRWLSWNGTPVTGDGIVYAVGRDVTDQREAVETQSRLATIVDSTADSVIGMALDGTIQTWNAAAERMYGYPAAAVVGQSIAIITPPDGAGELADALARIATGETVRHADTTHLRRDGSPIRLALTISPIRDSAGTIVGGASIAHDITEAAAARDEALAAARLKSQFVAMVSHEIRTPMNGVIGLTKLLLDTPLQPAQRQYAEAIGTSGRALLAVINDILDFSKIEAGRVSLAPAQFDPGHLVEDVARVAAEAARGKPVEVLNHYPSSLPVLLHGDAGRIRQVLLNLAGNAVKFTNEGHVVVRVEPAEPGRFTFCVSDTGIGIDDADLSKLFEPFTQADSTTSRQFGGTGLGLTISRQLVELMDGELTLDSAPGQGCTFSFTIPLEVPAGVTSRDVAGRTFLAERRLLVLDRNDTSRDLVADHTRSWGMSVTVTADPDVALHEMSGATGLGRPFEAIVVNQGSPGGLAVVERILGDPDRAAAVLFLLSGDPHGDSRRMSDPAVQILSKPVGPSALYNGLLQHLHPEAAQAAHDRQGVPLATQLSAVHGTVLLAEDNEINQMVAIDTLAALGYRADLARNGLEAVELASANRYAAILMDCQMPKMDGYQATAELRRREMPGDHIPIIAMTAGALADDKRRCLAAGMDDHLAKPIDPDELQATLARWATAESTNR